MTAYKNDLICMTFVYVQIVKCNPDPCLLLSQFLREECIIFVQNCYRKINYVIALVVLARIMCYWLLQMRYQNMGIFAKFYLYNMVVCCQGTQMLDPSPPLDNIRVMAVVWRLRGNIIRTALCWIVRHNVHSQQHTYMSSSYTVSYTHLTLPTNREV